MADNINAHCELCGKGYHICRRCDKDNNFAWKIHTDTAEHYKIYQIVKGNYLGIYTDKEAAEKLKNVDLSDLEEFKDDVKAIIKRLLKLNEKPKNGIFVKGNKPDDKSDKKDSKESQD